MLEKREQGDLSLYDPYQFIPENADELAILVRQIIECQKYLAKHPRSTKTSKKLNALEEQFEAMFDYVTKNHEFIEEYLDSNNKDLAGKKELLEDSKASEKDILDMSYLSRNAGRMYSYLGDFYSENKDEKLSSKTKDAYLKSVENFKFSMSVSDASNDYDFLKTYAWSVIKYFEHEDYNNIENDDLLTELKVLLLKFIDNFDEKSDLYDDLARINVLMADYFNSNSSTGGEDMRNLPDSQKRYISNMYEDAVRYSRKALLYSLPEDNSAETTYIDVQLQYARCLFRFGDEKQANNMLRDLLNTFKTLDAKVEIARQLFTSYGVNYRPVLEMAKQLLNQVVEFDNGIIDAHYILGRIALAEHTYDIEQTIGKIEISIKNILESDPEDKDNLARDLSEGMTQLRSTLFSVRASSVLDPNNYNGAN